jgi:hypothetical protein
MRQDSPLERLKAHMLWSTKIYSLVPSYTQVVNNELQLLNVFQLYGNALPPFMILKGKSVTPTWIPKSILDKEWRMAASSTGWTNIAWIYLVEGGI